MYANGVNLHSDGLPNEPKHTHLNTLHYTIATVSTDLLSTDAQSKHAITLPYRYNASGSWSNGTEQLAFVYGQTVFIESSASVFLQTQYNGMVYDMAPNTVLIVQKGQLLFNTSAVQPVAVKRVNTPVWDAPLEWQVWGEGVYSDSTTQSAASGGIPVMRSTRPISQLDVTRDLTDYCWYTTTVDVPSALNAATLTVDSASANSLLAFLNGDYVGTCEDHRKEGTVDPVQCNITVGDVPAGPLQLSILSVSFGIGNGLDINENPAEKHWKGRNDDTPHSTPHTRSTSLHRCTTPSLTHSHVLHDTCAIRHPRNRQCHAQPTRPHSRCMDTATVPDGRVPWPAFHCWPLVRALVVRLAVSERPARHLVRCKVRCVHCSHHWAVQCADRFDGLHARPLLHQWT